MLRLILCLTLLAGCAAEQHLKHGRGLAGSAWQLHAIQSMDDTQGTTRIEESGRFTLHFGADGQAVRRLACNRGTAQWKTAPATDSLSGSLQFGPIATTRALCPPPRLDERVARDMSFVRSYVLRDGKLFLSLMADGGIYEWHSLRE